MLTNKCYITAKYQSHTDDFIHLTLKNMPYVLYIGNFKHIDKIIEKLKRDVYFNSICRIRRVYEPEYPQFNTKVNPGLHSYFTNQSNKDLIWLESIKLTTLPEAKLCPVKEDGYFTLQDTYKNIHPYLTSNTTPPVITDTNKDKIVTVHGALDKENLLRAYRVLKVDGEALDAITIPPKTGVNIPKELRKFNLST